jgi:DNA ligase-1
MKRFAALLDRLAYEGGRNAKLALIVDYLRATPDPERGFALAALTGTLSFAEAKPAAIRGLIAERTDPVLFALSYDFVGDLSETVALMWPTPSLLAGKGAGRSEADEGAGISPSPGPAGTPLPRGERAGPPPGHNQPPLSLTEVVERLGQIARRDLPAQLAAWLDMLDETGRWALLKLITGGLRVGVSARLAKTAVAMLGMRTPDEIEEVWHGLTPPYAGLFAWAEGVGPRPETADLAPFRPAMLAHPVEDRDFDALDPKDFAAEWKWDGIRVQAAGGLGPAGPHRRLYTRTGDEISHAFPDLGDVLDALAGLGAAIDAELLVRKEGAVQSFNALQQRLNRKQVSARLVAEHPAHLRAYDILAIGGEDVRGLAFMERRARLEALVARLAHLRLDLSPLIPFADWEELAAHRAAPNALLGPADAQAVEGCMLKRRDGPYLPGRPRGQWFKWKRDPHLVDCVLMYAQRGHGKRSSFYSDFTFGLWRGDVLLPVGKAYFGFTDEELRLLDRHVRKATVNRFGPVREVAHGPNDGLVLEIAFEGLQRSTRHKSGVAMRFPRINRIRWDKPAREADELDALERLLGPTDASAVPEGTAADTQTAKETAR